MITVNKDIIGGILDIGGGGEGVISSIYGNMVTAIDNRQDELDELSYDCKKVIMDASAMNFIDAYFENVTAFYSFMYISKAKHKDVINEIYRVLQPDGNFYIWDTAIKCAYPEPFITDLDIEANGRKITTTYGIVKENAAQNAEYFAVICEKAGFKNMVYEMNGNHFYQQWKK